METYHALTPVAQPDPSSDGAADTLAIAPVPPPALATDADPKPSEPPAAVVNHTIEELAREGARRMLERAPGTSAACWPSTAIATAMAGPGRWPSAPGRSRSVLRASATCPTTRRPSTARSCPGGGCCRPRPSRCCWKAYSVQRTWDCCNILLNEYWIEAAWSNCSSGICGSVIRSYSGQDGGKWKTLTNSCGPGWDPIASSHSFGRYAGGLGYSSVTPRGTQAYGYKGGFDCGGNDFRNSYTNAITGNANGNWYCSYTYSWKKSLGFKYQAWCGTGAYGEK